MTSGSLAAALSTPVATNLRSYVYTCECVDLSACACAYSFVLRALCLGPGLACLRVCIRARVHSARCGFTTL
eukprot:6212260-Pleurochrysis_carterae.AAC.1